MYRYDQNVNFKEDFELTRQGIKKFRFVDGQPYAYNRKLKKDILFKGIHFQGMAKYEMIKFCNQPMTLFGRFWFQYNIIRRLKNFKHHLF